MQSEQAKVLGAVVIGAIVLAGALYYYANKTPDSALQDVESDLEQLSATTTISVPSANPLKQAAPTANPVEATNPFDNDYQNPFE